MTQKRLQGRISWGVSACLILLITAYIVSGVIIRSKIHSSMRALPSSVSVSYRGLHPLIFQSALLVQGLDILISPREDSSLVEHIYIERVELRGVNYFSWIFGNQLNVRNVLLAQCHFDLDGELLTGDFTWPAIDLPFGSASARQVELQNVSVSVQSRDAVIKFAQPELLVGEVTIDRAVERFPGTRRGDALVYLLNKSERQGKEMP